MGTVIARGLPRYVHSLPDDDPDFLDTSGGLRPKTVLTVPVVWGGMRDPAAFQVQFRQTNALTVRNQDAVAHLAELAGAMSTKLAPSRRAEEHEWSTFVSNILLERNREPSQILNARRDCYRHLAAELWRYAGDARIAVSIRVLDRHSMALGYVECLGPWTEAAKDQMYLAKGPSAGWAALETSGQVYYRDDARERSAFLRLPGISSQSLLAKRFCVRGQPSGVVSVDWSKVDGLSDLPDFLDRFHDLISQFERILLVLSDWEDQLFQTLQTNVRLGTEYRATHLLNEVFGGRECCLFLDRHYHFRLALVARSSAETSAIPPALTPFGEDLEGKVASSRRPIRGEYSGEGCLAVPLIARERVLGVILVAGRAKEPASSFTHEEETLLCEIADRLAKSFDSKWLDEDADDVLAEMKHLADEKGVLAVVTNLATEYMNKFHAQGAAVVVRDVRDGISIPGTAGVFKLLLARNQGTLREPQVFGGLTTGIWESEHARDCGAFRKELTELFGSSVAQFMVKAIATFELPFEAPDDAADGFSGYITICWQEVDGPEAAGSALEQVAQRAAAALLPVLCFARIKRELQRIGLYTKEFSSTHELSALGKLVLNTLLRSTGLGTGAMWIRDGQNDRWARIALVGEPESGAPALISDEQLPEYVANAPRGLFTPENGVIGCKYSGADVACPYLTIPLRFEKRLVGFARICSQNSPISRETERFLNLVADSAALAVNSALLLKDADDLAQPFALIGTMLGGFLHVMRNCLNNIGSPLRLIQDPVTDETERKELVEIIEKEVSRQHEVIRNIAMLASRRGETAPVNFKRLVEHAMPDITADFGAALRLIQRVEELDDDVVVGGNSSQLEIAFKMLVQNAIEAIGRRKGTLRIRARKRGPAAYLHITDTGPGMDAVSKLRCLQLFYTTKATGNGLGLPVVLGIVKRHNGRLRITSAPGKGAVFTIRVPERIPHSA